MAAPFVRLYFEQGIWAFLIFKTAQISL